MAVNEENGQLGYGRPEKIICDLNSFRYRFKWKVLEEKTNLAPSNKEKWG